MAKKGMRRPDGPEHTHNEAADVGEIQGKAKTGNAKAGPIHAPDWARDDYKTGDKFQ
ncbi:hypothetical protein [[Clostridium] polysaccharolyticum]|uniref:Uncharacterized protein n=1 Tax=[Clostridium] polysaccharolyticum TaxID=29364 RepID=A0A1I0DK08_9FIRM|nr:hypothetical protein [[Clostridium] polysaccharolyticum]SET32158.1 hypothetical protein SAMN04487772_1154 [[Clostridium] polysaccharolyticum]